MEDALSHPLILKRRRNMKNTARKVTVAIIISTSLLFAAGLMHVWTIAEEYETEYRATHMEVMS